MTTAAHAVQRILHVEIDLVPAGDLFSVNHLGSNVPFAHIRTRDFAFIAGWPRKRSDRTTIGSADGGLGGHRAPPRGIIKRTGHSLRGKRFCGFSLKDGK